MKEDVVILLATYNGERFLREQLDSILGQSFDGWRLLARDDGSLDATPAILADYERRHPEQIVVLRDDKGNLGALGNFQELMACADADYLFFSDQDDVWLPTKIERTLAELRTLESEVGPQTPLLVHTDLKVMNHDMTPRAESMWRYQKTDPVGGATLNRLVVQNNATGCTMGMNRSLRDLSLPIQAGAIMHDWWINLVASAFGRVQPMHEPTVLYRLHGRNEIGATAFNLAYVVRQAFDLLRKEGRQKRQADFAREYRQAAAFLDRFRDRLTPGVRKWMEVYADFDRLGFFRRRYAMLRYRFFNVGFIRNVGRLLIN